MSDVTKVRELPPCDICAMRRLRPATAKVDGKTTLPGGAWAFMCWPHYEQVGVGLGTGRGQVLELES